VLAAAKSLRPRPPAPVVVARAEPDAVELAAIAKARRAGRPEPEGVAAAVEAVMQVSEEPAGAEQVEVIVVRRPGDPPVMPPGSKVYGSVEDWDPYERFQR